MSKSKPPSAIRQLEESVRCRELQLREAALGLECKLLENQQAFWDNYVDPRDAFWDEQERRFWSPLTSGELKKDGVEPPVFRTETDLAIIRNDCRNLAALNAFAINGHENRISYIVGTGYRYRVASDTLSDEVIQAAQAVIDQFVKSNRFGELEQELVRRGDRDGEWFIRRFPQADGTLKVRVIEPDQVKCPAGREGNKAFSFGVETEPDDVETVNAFWVDGERVEGVDVHHAKFNVDRNCKRGVPIFFPVRANLRRADKLLRNMSTVADIQAAIALVRKHDKTTSSGMTTFADSKADFRATNPMTGRDTRFHRLQPGTVLDAPAGTSYDYPAGGIEADRFVKVLDAELRGIAARVVMPEFMFSSNASNANYASTLVAEGPAVKKFGRDQEGYRVHNGTIVHWALEAAVDVGVLPAAILDDTVTTLEVEAPAMVVRNPLQEAQSNAIEVQNGVLSPQQWAASRGRDWDQVAKDLDEVEERTGHRPGSGLQLPGMDGTPPMGGSGGKGDERIEPADPEPSTPG